MTSSRVPRKVLALLVSSASIAAVLTVSGHAGASAPDRPVQQADDLAAAPDLDRSAPAGYDPAQARSVAGRRGAAVPLPPNGNFNGIEWERAGGVFGDAEIEGALEFNAACQWMRAAHDGTNGDALAVLDRVPNWPTFRHGDGSIGQAVAEAHAGGGPVYEAMLAECEASHDREVRYAAEQGLTPSS